MQRILSLEIQQMKANDVIKKLEDKLEEKNDQLKDCKIQINELTCQIKKIPDENMPTTYSESLRVSTFFSCFFVLVEMCV